MKKNNTSNAGKVIAIGAGMVALAAAGYFFLGPNGKKNQKAARGWMIKMKGEVVEKIEKVKDVTEDTYHNIVDTVAKSYVASGGKDEVAKLAKELKSHWKSISSNGKIKAKKAVKKVMKKVAKKVSKK